MSGAANFAAALEMLQVRTERTARGKAGQFLVRVEGTLPDGALEPRLLRSDHGDTGRTTRVRSVMAA